MSDSLPAGRYFLALWPDPPMREAIQAIAHDWLHGVRDACRPTAADRYHLTLRFLGDLDAGAARHLAVCAETWSTRAWSPFEFTLDRFGHFGSRVAWLGCTYPPSALTDLHDALDHDLRHAGFAAARPGNFQPHVTLASDMRGPWPAAPAAAPCMPWTVHRYVLVRSVPEKGYAYRVAMSFD